MVTGALGLFEGVVMHTDMRNMILVYLNSQKLFSKALN